MAQNAAPILFVSMDDKGVKSSAIRAHAARRGHQKSRQNMAKLSSDTAATQPKNKIATSDSASKAKARRKVNLRATQDQSISEAPKEVPKDDSKELEHENQIVPAKKETSSPLQSFMSSGKSEHFVQMFFEIMKPSYTAAYGAFNVPNIIMQQWPLFMHHEVFFWTEAAAIQGLQDSLRYPDKPPSKQVLLYKANALTCLKRELLNIKNGQLDDYLVMSIFVLASLDLMAGDEIAHDAHKKILRTAFAAAGGLHNYGSFVRNTTMRLDSFWRSTASEPTTPAVPLLQPSRIPQLPTHPFSPHLTDLVGKLPEGFKELALQLKLPLDVLEVLGRIADPTQKPLPSMPSSNDNRSPSSNCGMYLDFWESCPSLSSSYRDRNNEPPLERLLALALLIYSTNRDASNPLRMYNCIANGAIYDLCYDLPQCETRRSRHEENCLFWIWTVTVDAMRNRFGELTVQGETLLEQQRKRFPGVIGTSLEEQVLKRFWFPSEYSDGSCLFVPNPMYSRTQPRRGDTYTSARSGQSESASSPGASGSSSWGKSETMDSWSITTPRHERDEMEFGVRSNSSQVDETESVGGRWHGPGFGLLPSGKQLGDAPELSYGRIGTSRRGPVKCLAG